MSIPSDDEIARFFANLTPEDFLVAPRRTPASRPASYHEDVELFALQGRDDFDRFVMKHLDELASSGRSTLVLHNGRIARTYTPRDHESVDRFVARVTRQVARFDATWVFVGVPGEASMTDLFDPSSPSQIARARRGGHMLQTLNWYAESIEPADGEVRYGIIYDQDGEQRVVQSTLENGANPQFVRILHPARRR